MIEGVIEKGQMVVWVGSEGLADLARAVATGQPFRGHETKKARVAIIDADDTLRDVPEVDHWHGTGRILDQILVTGTLEDRLQFLEDRAWKWGLIILHSVHEFLPVGNPNVLRRAARRLRKLTREGKTIILSIYPPRDERGWLTRSGRLWAEETDRVVKEVEGVTATMGTR